MRKNPWLMLFVLVLVFVSISAFVVGSSAISLFGGGSQKISMISKNSIMKIRLEGVILDASKIVRTLSKYRKDSDIKAFVIEINSPGGAVGPSQELFAEIKRTREEFKKPVVAVTQGVMASGAYYAAAAADKIVVAPGALVGSIGVIMEFANLEKLYDWAKITRYSITTGKFKDSGAEYRPMREDEKALFQEMIDDVWAQFKNDVAAGRKLPVSQIEPLADGRVMTGKRAIVAELADIEGPTSKAYDVAAELAGLAADEYEVFEIPRRKPGLFEMLSGEEEDPYAQSISQIKRMMGVEWINQPFFLMPGIWTETLETE